MAKALKQMLASQLGAALEDSPSGMLVVDPGGMTVESAMAFRRDLRENAGGARLRIIHNRTARVALRGLELTDEQKTIDQVLAGPSAIIYGGAGPISIARVVRDWRRKEKGLVVKAAVADGEVLAPEVAENLAEMPDLEQLKGMIASLLVSGARGIAASMAGVYGGIARVLQARLDADGFGGGATEETPAEQVSAEQVSAEQVSAEETAPTEEAPAAEDQPAPQDGGEEAKGDE